MELNLSSLGTLVPEAIWCMLYEIRANSTARANELIHPNKHILAPTIMCSQQLSVLNIE